MLSSSRLVSWEISATVAESRTAFAPSVLDIVAKRLLSRGPNVRIGIQIGCHVEIGTRPSTFSPAMPDVVQKWVLARFRDVLILEKVPTPVEKRVGQPAFRMPFSDEMLHWVPTRGRYVRIARQIPFSIHELRNAKGTATLVATMLEIMCKRFLSRLADLRIFGEIR
jgi:hypothetical protein